MCVFTDGSRSEKAGVETVGFHSSFTAELVVRLLMSGRLFLLLVGLKILGNSVKEV